MRLDVSDTGRESFQGTRVGLAISKAIVEARGGKIAVASAEGAGTTFSVLLPR